MSGYLLGIDIGSSSIKVSVIDADTGRLVASASSPATELTITARISGWAEQHPDLWWRHLKEAIQSIAAQNQSVLGDVKAIGIAYQMHGLVVVDKDDAPLRDAIIWCDSRAVPYGQRAFEELGEKRCLENLLNSPGNFTAAKLAWIKDQEPELFSRIHKILLPGEYIGLRLTGEAVTTPSGLSEGIMWDAVNNCPAKFLLDYYGFDSSLLCDLRPSFAEQGRVASSAAAELGLPVGVPVTYRAGDQPNNAFSLNVLQPGEAATTAGTSGVVYGIADRPTYDIRSRVNTFVHVNHTQETNRYGVLLCLNGTGSLNQWLKRILSGDQERTIDYETMNVLASQANPGADGLKVFPYGNGAERTLENRELGALFENLNFNRHGRSELLRAGQEGIVFALHYGVEIMREAGISVETVKAGKANMFLSPLFRQTFATVTDATIELYNTDGSIGAARGAGIGAGIYGSFSEAFSHLKCEKIIEPEKQLSGQYAELYQEWKTRLQIILKQ
jgi:xylulokinase